MVRFHNIINALALSSLLPSLVAGVCKDRATASITEGAWSTNGVNGTWQPARYDEDNINTDNPGWTIPDELWSYPHGEKGRRGPNYRTQYTCSKLSFCNPEGAPADTADEADGRKLVDEFSLQDVWKLASNDAFDACDFTDAVLIGTTNATSCVEVEKDDLVADGELSFYASKENCAAGQKIAVQVADWESTMQQCRAIAEHIPASGRVRECDCDFSRTPFAASYGRLCARSYQVGCFNVEMPGDCCDTGTCMSKIEVFDTPEGNAYEMARREGCSDDIPGNCYNMNGVASDMSTDGSTDCCSQTCSSCGSELASGAVFEMCTSNVPGNMTATCGRLSRYSLEDHICDFSKCATDTHWASKGDAVWKYMGLSKPTDLAIVDGTVDISEPVEGDKSMTEEDADALNDSAASSVSIVVVGVLSAGFVAALL